MADKEIDRMVVRLVGDGTGYQKMMREAQSVTRQASASITSDIKKTGMSFDQLKAKAGTLGTTLTTRLTLPLTAMAGVGVKAFSDFDKAMTESTAIMKTTSSQAERMRQLALDISTGGKANQSARDLAESYFFLASAGKDAEQSMALLPTVQRFATAGAFNMARATDLLTDAQSALGLSSTDAAQDMTNMTRLSDVLVKANILANASVAQFSEALTNDAGAAMKSFNIDVEEGVAVLAAMADQGNKGIAAGSEFARMIRLMGNSAIKEKENFAKWNITVFDGTGKLRNMADIVQDMETAFKDLQTEQKLAALEQLGFTALTAKAILPIIGTSEAIRKYEAGLRKAGGLTEDVANKQMKGFANQMTVLKNRVTSSAIELGEQLAPTVSNVGNFIAGLSDRFRALTPEQKEMVVQIGLAVAAIGPLILALKGVLAVLGGLKLILAGGLFGGIALAIGVLIEKTVGWENVIKKLEPAFRAIADFFADIEIPRLLQAIGDQYDELAIRIQHGFFGREKAEEEIESMRNIKQSWRELSDDAEFAVNQANKSLTKHREALEETRAEIEKNREAMKWDESAFDTSDFKIDLSGMDLKPLDDAEQERLLKDLDERKKIREAEEKAQKIILEKMKKAQKEYAESFPDVINALEKERDTFGMTRKEIALYEAEQMGASEAQKALLTSLHDSIEAKEDAKKATEDAKEAEEKFRRSIKGFGIEATGRGAEAMSRILESRRMALGRDMDPTKIESEAKKKLTYGEKKELFPKPISGMLKLAEEKFGPTKQEAGFALQQKIWESLVKIEENTKSSADKEPVNLRPAGITDN